MDHDNVLQFPPQIIFEKMVRDCMLRVTKDWREAKRRGLNYQQTLEYMAAQKAKREARRTKRLNAKGDK